MWSKHMRVKCECCGSRIDEGNAVQEIGGTYLCESCDNERIEEAEERMEEEEYAEYSSLESIYRNEWRYE